MEGTWSLGISSGTCRALTDRPHTFAACMKPLISVFCCESLCCRGVQGQEGVFGCCSDLTSVGFLGVLRFFVIVLGPGSALFVPDDRADIGSLGLVRLLLVLPASLPLRAL